MAGNYWYGNNRENQLNKVASLSMNDLIRVVASDASRNITVENLVKLLSESGASKVLNVVNVANNYVINSSNDVVLFDVTSGTLTATLPAASSSTGLLFVIKKSDGSANDLIVQGVGGDLIDGSLTQTLLGSGGARPSISVVSDGSAWWITNA